MKILCVVVLAGLASMAEAKNCVGEEKGKIKQFNTRGNEVHFPCKYYALKQQLCGKYEITMTPGNLWLGNNYYLNTIWLSVKDTTTGKTWDGRTTNKMAIKYILSYNDTPRELFNKKGGDLNAKDLFDTGLDSGIPYIKTKDGDFKLTVKPWDPESKNKYTHPTYKLECKQDDKTKYNDYPAQMCGGLNTSARVLDRAVAMGLPKKHREIAIYYDVFMSDVVQTDDECIEAASLIQNKCQTRERRIHVLRNCLDILYNLKHTECVTYFQCTPMEAFNKCLKWGCTGSTAFDKKETDLCKAVGEAIDLCGNIAGAGNLTTMMQDANCFNEYLNIEFNPSG